MSTQVVISIHISIRNLLIAVEFPTLESRYEMHKKFKDRISKQPPSNSPTCMTEEKGKGIWTKNIWLQSVQKDIF